MVERTETDADALRRVERGEEEALAVLYDRHSPLLFALVRRIVGQSGEAEDVLQETWVQVWERAKSFRAERGSVEAWLITIARSRALDRLRRRRVRLDAEATLRDQASDRSEVSVGHEPPDVVDRRQVVRGALAKLKAEHRQILEVAFFEGLTQSEIAQRLDLPVGTVKTWMRRGLETLRSSLSEYGSLSSHV